MDGAGMETATALLDLRVRSETLRAHVRRVAGVSFPEAEPERATREIASGMDDAIFANEMRLTRQRLLIEREAGLGLHQERRQRVLRALEAASENLYRCRAVLSQARYLRQLLGAPAKA